ncbi:MAG: L,D-transpeptidase family protein [Caulobacteraceae bacterium]|jgi:L,D-peptidoglycan transpeptidase YkuD (ErfK/YbiS/YcfS/YnhG family)
MIFTVFADGWIKLPRRYAPCSMGRSGVKAPPFKVEGDGVSPVGTWPLRRVLYRADRIREPDTGLPIAPIAADDGWCDAPDDPNYNRQIKLPYPASAEALWREDEVYDLIVVLGYNDSPVVPGAGSAIFLHVASPDHYFTEGCFALEFEDLQELLRDARAGDALEVRRVRRNP